MLTADWEVELGVVIGQTARRVSVEKAMDYVAGFCVLNDITERGRFARSGQFVNAKSGDTFTPVGPYLVTQDEINDYRNLGIYFDLNGERYQNGTTASMIFTTEFLISHISELMTLMPGDIIATGTPRESVLEPHHQGTCASVITCRRVSTISAGRIQESSRETDDPHAQLSSKGNIS